ncbi:hypothetical protein PGB90_005827 [Kerria lacca]
MGTYEFKKFRFYSPIPRAIHCLRYDPVLCKLALSRSNNTLEIWDVKHTPHVDRVFIGDKDDSIESIAWYNGRLFTASLCGSIFEHDLLNLSIKYEICVTSGSCWCIDINVRNNLLAAGTEDGYINIIKIFEDSLIHEKLLDKQEGRILCIAWEANGEFLATGSLDAVRVWNVKTGHAIHKLTPGRSEMNKPTVVWCLTVTNDFTIISGDSRGKITFWDGNRGLHIDSHQSHKAAVLSVCLNSEQSKVYCAGVDPVIASFEKINVRASGFTNVVNYKWIKSIQRVIHDHDVRALAMCEEKLFSGGVDGYLALSSYPPKVLIKYSPMLQSKKVCLAHEAKILLITYDEYMEIWHWSFKITLSHAAMIKSYKNGYIRCSSISSDGTWIAYSTESVFRLLRVFLINNFTKTDIKRISGLPSELKTVAVSICFSSDSKYMVVVDKRRRITIVELNSDETVRMLHTLNIDNEVLTDVIHSVCISKQNEYLVVADRSSNVAVWKNFQYYCSLPKYTCAPTAMAISHNQKYVVVSYADHIVSSEELFTIVEFNMDKKRFTSFSKALGQKHPKQWLNRQFPVEGILFDRTNSNVIMIYDDTTICIIDKTKKLPEVNLKIPRLDTVKSPENSDTSESSSSQFSLNRSDNIAFHVLKEFKHIVYLSTFEKNELLVVEVNPDTLLKKLPGALQKNRFGTM